MMNKIALCLMCFTFCSFSQRENVQEHLDWMREVIWEIDQGEIEKKAGLQKLDWMILDLKFYLWFAMAKEEIENEACD